MSQEDRDKVHLAIDAKLQEIEDSGLTREELLSDNAVGKGLPVADDPVF